MINIICLECGKDSGIKTTGSAGGDGAIAQDQLNWIFKMPLLIGIPETWLICSKDCYEKLRTRKIAEYNVSPETLAEAQEKTEKFKAKIPQMAEETAKVMSNLVRFLNNRQKPY